ncbi:hypothetical protein PIB30_030790 [Stylosanthes scabra]|uniref:Uncharacterized protein n=1 Tax=Stylosanthes scabra TaxID=79078 RepID=A0ABU6QC48_9FABA|nr:hypothetical protein [Stylosanthes scabra]
MDWALLGRSVTLPPLGKRMLLIRFPSSFDELPTAFRVASTLSFSSGCLRVRLFVACRFASLFVDVAERVVTFARFSKDEVMGAVFKISALFIYKKSEMGKKKSCQDVKVPRPLDAVETRLYGWVEEAVLT